MNKRIVYIIILAVIVGFTLYEELHLRHYLFRKHQLIWLADCLPNFLAAVLLSFAVVLVKDPDRPAEAARSIGAVVTGLVVYEFVQIWMPHMVFDIKDIIASLAGGALSYGIVVWINSRVASR